MSICFFLCLASIRQVLFRMLKEVVRFGVVIVVILLGFSMAMFALFGGRVPSLETEDVTSSSTLDESSEEGTTGVLRYVIELPF